MKYNSSLMMNQLPASSIAQLSPPRTPVPIAQPQQDLCRVANTNSSSKSHQTLATKTKRTRSKRSKNGCLSCKKLKIKCTEEKPACEYCEHTGRECVYLNKSSLVKLKVVKPKQKTLIKSAASNEIIQPQLINDSILKLNSMSSQLEVSNFQLQLLKFYLEFGANFFTFKVEQKHYEFWELEVPKLWCSSDLIKNAIYTVSSARLLANYGNESMRNVYVENNNDGCKKDNSDSMQLNLFEQSQSYMQKTNELMEIFSLMIGVSAEEENVDMVGQLLVTKIIMTAATAMFPDADNVGIPQNQGDISNFGIFKMIDITKEYQQIIRSNFRVLQNSKYIKMFAPNYSVLPSEHKSFKFTEHLRDYILQKTDHSDVLQVSYLNFISRIEANCHKAINMNYPIALFAPVREVSLDQELTKALKRADHIALKLMNSICCIISIFDFKLARGCGLWNEVIEFYKKTSFAKFNGKFEDSFDHNIYSIVMARKESKIPYDLKLIHEFGSPLEDFISGRIPFSPNDCPPVFF